jgi:hypothetical protein
MDFVQMDLPTKYGVFSKKLGQDLIISAKNKNREMVQLLSKGPDVWTVFVSLKISNAI